MKGVITTTTTTTDEDGSTVTVTKTVTHPAEQARAAPDGGAEPEVVAVTDLATLCDDKLSAVIKGIPLGFCDLKDISASRKLIEGMLAMMPKPAMPADVAVTEEHVPGFASSDPSVRVKIYRPAGLPEGAPCIYWIHGGGMVLGSADMDDYASAMRAVTHSALVVSVDYRLAPESAAPALVNECYAGLRWTADHAAELGIDRNRLMISGASAGGGLAAGTALKARDLAGPRVCAQLLIYPMLDHTNSTPSSHAICDTRVWNRLSNQQAWEMYLQGTPPDIYASPATCTDLTGLPPTYINVGTLDLFLDEDVRYATALQRAGVSCELHVYPGQFHGSNLFATDHPTSLRWQADEADFVNRALAGQL